METKNTRQSILNAPCITQKYGVNTKYLQGVQALPGFFFRLPLSIYKLRHTKSHVLHIQSEPPVIYLCIERWRKNEGMSQLVIQVSRKTQGCSILQHIMANLQSRTCILQNW